MLHNMRYRYKNTVSKKPQIIRTMSKKRNTAIEVIIPFQITSLLDLTCSFIVNDGESIVNLDLICKSVHVSDDVFREVMKFELDTDEPLKPRPRLKKGRELDKDVEMNGVAYEKCSSYREAYCSWREYFRKRFDDIYKNRFEFRRKHAQAIRAWVSLENDLPKSITETFRSGLCCRDFYCSSLFQNIIEDDSDGVISFFAVYSVRDGQETFMDNCLSDNTECDTQVMRDGLLRGIFGGYNVYNHLINMRMLNHEQSGNTLDRVDLAHYLSDEPLIPISLNFRHEAIGRSFYLDQKSGQIVLPSRHTHERPRVVGQDFTSWFATFAERVRTGYYRITRCIEARSPFLPFCGVNLYPDRVPDMTCVVTNFVEVRASSVFMPEHGSQWSYSIRVRLLPGGKKCQLTKRHWVITNENGHVERVSGSGVVGRYPTLWCKNDVDDFGYSETDMSFNGYFSYQSQTGRIGKSGSFGGELEFVPGSIGVPTGPSFRVKVGTMILSRPWVSDSSLPFY